LFNPFRVGGGNPIIIAAGFTDGYSNSGPPGLKTFVNLDVVRIIYVDKEGSLI
jgi:hypothetical protein